MMEPSTVDTSSLAPGELLAIVEGRHGDPFAFLGPHRSQDGRITVRTFVPGALGVELVDRATGAVLAVSSLVHAGGVFLGPVQSDAGYKLRILWPNGAQETEDPYRFGPLLGDLDLHLISQGTHYQLSSALGANPVTVDGIQGVRFAVWAPNARRVSVVGDFNSWDGRRHPMRLRREAGVWEIFIPDLTVGDRYKFEILDGQGNLLAQKADPVARASEAAPSTASIVASTEPVKWRDAEWLGTFWTVRYRSMKFMPDPGFGT